MILHPLSNLVLNTSHLRTPGFRKNGRCSKIVLPLSIISDVVLPLLDKISEFLSKLKSEYQAIKIEDPIVLPFEIALTYFLDKALV